MHRERMDLTRTAKIFLANAAWRATGARWAGRTLVDSLGSVDPDSATIAGTLLARSGERAEPLLLDALHERRQLGTVLLLLGDVGRPERASDISPFARDPDPDVARAARDALRILQARHGH